MSKTTASTQSMKVAIVHDWLVENAGAERVLKALVETYPDADVFSLVDFLNDKDRKNILNSKSVTTSFIQHLPFAKKYFRNYLPFFPKAIESFKLDDYELIISSSWAVAKGVRRQEGQTHVCYCHTPIRYAWDLYEEYTKNLPFFKIFFVKLSLAYIRRWDIKSLDRVDYFIANSKFVQERIKRTYKRESLVIYPPVDTDDFTYCEKKEHYYITASRLVSYKKTQLVVEAFNAMPEKKLFVVGNGIEYNNIAAMANKNITLLGHQDKEELIKYLQKAKGFVYAAIEDFGILPVEALSCGTPLIALNYGGTAETLVHQENGIHFDTQTKEKIIEAVEEFENFTFSTQKISHDASSYAKSRFQEEIRDFIKTIKI